MIAITVGYDQLIMKKEDALTMIDILERAQRYERKYWNKDERTAKGMTDEYTYHVYPNDKEYGMSIISDELYEMAKLAGKPERD